MHCWTYWLVCLCCCVQFFPDKSCQNDLKDFQVKCRCGWQGGLLEWEVQRTCVHVHVYVHFTTMLNYILLCYYTCTAVHVLHTIQPALKLNVHVHACLCTNLYTHTPLFPTGSLSILHWTLIRRLSGTCVHVHVLYVHSIHVPVHVHVQYTHSVPDLQTQSCGVLYSVTWSAHPIAWCANLYVKSTVV